MINLITGMSFGTFGTSLCQILVFSFVVGVVAFFVPKVLFINYLSENKVLTICTTELRPNFAGRVFFSFDFLIFVVVTSPYL